MVVVFVHGSVQGIFDGNNGSGGAAVLDAAEDIFETGTGEEFDLGTQQLAGGLFAESAAFALKGDFFARRGLFPRRFHLAPSQRRASGRGRPSRSMIRSTLWSTRSMTVCGAV